MSSIQRANLQIDFVEIGQCPLPYPRGLLLSNQRSGEILYGPACVAGGRGAHPERRASRDPTEQVQFEGAAKLIWLANSLELKMSRPRIWLKVD